MLKPDQAQNKAMPAAPDTKGAKPTIIRCPKCKDPLGERWHGKVFNVKACRCEQDGRS